MPRGVYVHRVRPVGARFWAKVDKDGPIPQHRPELGPCWIWTASTARFGYGYIGVEKGDIRLAHRFAWELAEGPLSADQNVLHHCDNPPCVRRSHLFLGTHNDNVRDKVLKLRHTYGERHPNAKVTVAEVLQIRALAAAGRSHVLVALRFGISDTNVRHIVHRRTWRHIA